MSETVVVVPDADILASAVAARLVVKIIDAQASRGAANIVLTGGRVAAKVLRAVKELPASDAVDWSRVDLPAGDGGSCPPAARLQRDPGPRGPARRPAARPGPDPRDAAVRRPGRRRRAGRRARYAGELATPAPPGYRISTC